MADRSADAARATRPSRPDLRQGAVVGAVAWAVGYLFVLVLGSVSFRFVPSIEALASLEGLLRSVAVYNALHVPVDLYSILLLPSIVALLAGGNYVAENEPGDRRAGASLAVGYAGAVFVTEIAGIAFWAIQFPGAPLSPGATITRIVAAGVLAGVFGSLGTIVRKRGGRSRQRDRRHRDDVPDRSGGASDSWGVDDGDAGDPTFTSGSDRDETSDGSTFSGWDDEESDGRR